jgi:hypothetical protein
MNKVVLLLTITGVIVTVFILLLATVGINRAVPDANSTDDEDVDGSDDGVTGDPTMYAILSIMPTLSVLQYYDDPAYAHAVLDSWGPTFNVYPYTDFEEGRIYDDWKLQLLPGEVTTYNLETWVTAKVSNGMFGYDVSWESKHVDFTFESGEHLQYLFKTRYFFWSGGDYMLDIHIFGKLNDGEVKEIGTPYQSLVEVNLL